MLHTATVSWYIFITSILIMKCLQSRHKVCVRVDNTINGKILYCSAWKETYERSHIFVYNVIETQI